MKTSIFKIVFASLFLCLLSGCTLQVYLTKNRIPIPVGMEGIWESIPMSDESELAISFVLIDKVNDYQLSLQSLSNSEESNSTITFHKFGSLDLICLSGTNANGENIAETYAYKLNGDNTIELFDLYVSGSNYNDSEVFDNTPWEVRELVFEKYLDEGKILQEEKPHRTYEKKFTRISDKQ